MKKIIKAWAIISEERIIKEILYQWGFEKRKHIKEQEVFVIGQEKELNKYLKKWKWGAEKWKIIPCEIKLLK